MFRRAPFSGVGNAPPKEIITALFKPMVEQGLLKA
jgi:hypothetical protein